MTQWFDNESPGLEQAWHAVAASSEVTDAPFGVTLLGRKWALVRLGPDIAAFADRCPHRLAPLRIGTVCGELLQCKYHGWKFEASGRCVDVPALGPDATIPPRSSVATPARVVERYGLIWMAVEEPVTPFPEFEEWGLDGYDCVMNAPRRSTSGAGQLVDNFMDATHLPTVHTGTFGVADSTFLPPYEVETDTDRAWCWTRIEYRNLDDPLVATGEHPEIQPQDLLKRSEGPTTAYVRLEFPVTGATIAFLFACCPETSSTTRLFKLMARNDFAGDATLLAEALDFEDRVLDEDLAVLEAYDDNRLALDLKVEVHTRADRLSVAYRRLVATLLS